MGKWDFDPPLRRRVEQAEREQAERDEVNAPDAMFAVFGQMWRDVTGWAAEHRRRFPHPIRPGELRVVKATPVDPPHYDGRPPLPRRESVQAEPEPRDTEPPRAPVPAPPPADPFEAMSIEQLRIAGEQPMPHAQRLELERALNAAIKARRAPTNLSAAEHERLSRSH